MAKKILIADDDPSICDSLQMMLSLEGYEVDTVVDGQAIYKLEDNFPDLLLLDTWMNGLDGRVICKYLKSSDDTKHIPIIMISASRDIHSSAKDSGADDFIEKPFEQEELYSKISKYIG